MGVTDVWRDIDFYYEERFHPTQKPIVLIERLIKASSNPGDTVLDPFSGAGSTQLASINTNRNYIAIELSEEYYNIALERINKLISPLNQKN